MNKYIILLVFSFIVKLSFVNAQILKPVTWEFEKKVTNENTYELVFKASIEDTWHLYAMDLPEGGPIPTSFHFDKSENYELIGNTIEKVKPETKFDQTFGMEMKLFSNEAVFIQKVKILNDQETKITGFVEFMSCDDSRCLPPKEAEFEFTFIETKDNESALEAKVEIGEPLISFNDENEYTKQNIIEGIEGESDSGKKSMLLFFLLSFVAGLAAILTPCVFPMIPMTITFFMNQSKSRGKAVLQGLIFGISIIIIYTSIGVIVSLTSAGADFANQLSTHWIPNIIFFALFLIFAASFFGMFDLVLPSGLVNKTDKQVDKGGYLGAFFMALTLVIVSFSCTGPIVGALLVEAASGAVLKPTIGMFGFALAFALPFTIFAIFPGTLKNLPKSGGWLNSVKVILGFIVLAFSLKFLSVVDQTYHWGILPREIYLAIWIVLFTMMGFYLLGKIKFAHDSDLPSVKFPRFMLAVASFAFVMYMIPGMFGAPLKGISSLIPPKEGHSFDLVELIKSNKSASISSVDETALCGIPKYADFLHLPHGLEGYFDYEEGMKCAKDQNKPVLLDFKGHACSNCKAMEANVWSHPDVLKRLKEDYIIIALYVDDKAKLPEDEWITSSYDGKVKKTMGKKNLDFQITKYQTNSQPYYVLVDHEGNQLTSPMGMDLYVDRFIEFLDEGKKNFKK
ncbi:cytochrome c biogenesis protein CcdA [Bacteroidota bacterium]